MATKHFDDEAVIFRQGDLSGEVYLVQTGAVRITKTTTTGETVHLGEVGPNSIFGEMALIDSTLRMATARAVGPTSCLVVDAVQLSKMIEQLSGEALRLYHDMLAYIRGTLPFEARTPQQQARGETDKDREGRQLLAQLPAVIASLGGSPRTVRAMFEMFGQYVRRRLPGAAS